MRTEARNRPRKGKIMQITAARAKYTGKINLMVPGDLMREDLVQLATETGAVGGSHRGDWTDLATGSRDSSEIAWERLTSDPLECVTATVDRVDAASFARQILSEVAGGSPAGRADVLEHLRALTAELEASA
jgi:hypothetical protein